MIIGYAHEIIVTKERLPNSKEVCRFFNRRKVREEDILGERLISDIDTFFKSSKPVEIKQRVFHALKYRWGYLDHSTHKINEVLDKYSVNIDDLISAESNFISRLGWKVKSSDSVKRKWQRL